MHSHCRKPRASTRPCTGTSQAPNSRRYWWVGEGHSNSSNLTPTLESFIRWCRRKCSRSSAPSAPSDSPAARKVRAAGLYFYLMLTIIFLPALRLADYIVVGSDSGRITILEYNPGKNVFEKVVIKCAVCVCLCSFLPPHASRRQGSPRQKNFYNRGFR